MVSVLCVVFKFSTAFQDQFKTFLALGKRVSTIWACSEGWEENLKHTIWNNWNEKVTRKEKLPRIVHSNQWTMPRFSSRRKSWSWTVLWKLVLRIWKSNVKIIYVRKLVQKLSKSMKYIAKQIEFQNSVPEMLACSRRTKRWQNIESFVQ